EDYGRDLSRSFIRSFTGAGGTVVGQDPYLDESRDLSPYVRRLQRHAPRVVMLAASTSEGASRIIAEARSRGVTAQFMGGDGLESLVQKGAGFDGTLVGTLFHRDQSERARAFYRA